MDIQGQVHDSTQHVHACTMWQPHERIMKEALQMPDLGWPVRWKGGQLNHLLGARGTPGILSKIKPWSQDSKMDVPSWVGEGPIPGEGVGWGGDQAPSLHAPASPLPLALHDPTLINSSTTPWKASSYNRMIGHSDQKHLHQKEKNWGSRASWRQMRSQVLNWDLPADLTHFFIEGTASDQKGIPSPNAGPHTPAKSPQHSLSPAEGAQPKAPIATSSTSILGKAGKREASSCQLSPSMDFWGIIPIQQPSPPLVEGNKGEQEVQPQGHASCRRSMVNIQHNIMPYGRQQPLGSHLHNRRLTAGGMPPPALQGLLPTGLSSYCLQPTEFPGHLPGNHIGSSPGTAGLCRSVQSQTRGLMWSCQGAPTVHGAVDDHWWGLCYGGLPVLAGGGETRTFPTLEEKATLLGKGNRT